MVNRVNHVNNRVTNPGHRVKRVNYRVSGTGCKQVKIMCCCAQ